MTSVLKTDTDEFVQLYPNPAQTSIDYKGRTNSSESLLKAYTFDSDHEILDVSALPAGIYFLKIELDNATIVLKKIIKE